MLAALLGCSYGQERSLELIPLAIEAAVAGLIVAQAHMALGRVLGERERDALRIERMARQGTAHWIDEYSRWLHARPRSPRWRKWPAVPSGLAFLVAIVVRDQPWLPGIGTMLVSVVGIVGLYTCVRLLSTVPPSARRWGSGRPEAAED